MSEQGSSTGTTTAPARPRPFGTTVDPVEAGRRGGIASGLSRRMREQTRLEEAVLERGGYARWKVVELRLKRQRELDAERIRLDSFVSQLITEADALRETVSDLRDECDTLRAERAALDEQAKQRRQALDSDDAIALLLAEIGEDRVRLACIACGWIDGEDVDAVA